MNKNLWFDSDKNRLIRTFNRQKTDRVPYFEYFYFNSPLVNYVLDTNVTEEYPDWDTALQFAMAVGMDAVVGTVVRWYPGEVMDGVASDGTRHYSGGNLSNMEAFNNSPPPIGEALEILDQRIEKLKQTSIGNFVYVTHFFPALHVSMGLENFCTKLYDDFEFVEHMADKVFEYLYEGVKEACKRSIDFLFIDCDCAFKTGLMINPNMFYKIWYERTKLLISPAKEKGIPVTFHSDGDLRELLPLLVELGFSAIHPVEPAANDIYEIKQEYGDRICIMGNIDVAGVLAYGSSQDVERDVEEHIKRLAPGGGYVCGSSTHCFYGLPVENCFAMINALHRHGKVRQDHKKGK